MIVEDDCDDQLQGPLIEPSNVPIDWAEHASAEFKDYLAMLHQIRCSNVYRQFQNDLVEHM
jgi:hypothetical protein